MREYSEEELDRLNAAQMSGYRPHDRNGSSEPIGAHPVNWRQLPDFEAGGEWAALREWVEWFTVRYNVPVSVVPDCWWKHGQLVEELSALHVSHRVAFDSRDTGFGAIGWHERLSQALPRLNRAGAGCAGGHNETRPRSWSKATDETEWDAWTNRAHAD